MFEGVEVTLLDETVELPDELTEETDVPDEVCDVEDTEDELTVEETVEEAEEEAPPIMSLAPQIDGLLPAAPSDFLR
jgi:hypothetical protein